MTISILICSLDNRAGMLIKLLRHLDDQIVKLKAENKVEVIVNSDNKEKSTGRKRQELLEDASGKYVIFIDDDDWVSDNYVEELLKAAKSNADCFGINGWMTTNGHNKINWRLSKDYQNVTIKEKGWPVYLRTVNHITAVKRELALQAGFPDISNAEDKAYSEAVKHLVKTEHKIHPPLYHYRYQTHNKEYV